ncbi:ABC transporter ATP-binding protein [Tabrizicola sp.]|uniref:ABC transporter ATP-binding protein n=1 Tax=Tabrizicola sp. TaxID=2005166 RepID=UPI001A4F219C|nr:ABC transporter ATP-binding protein [Tabrizicola sp.]MBL9073996.1 ABC transporter ATP-binding protein [Tabrizicola sp.]
MTGILTASDVGKSYGSGDTRMAIIDGLNLSIAKGEFVSLVGPSGCGKTTLLMCLSGLLSPNLGKVGFKGQVVTAPPIGLSVVFQDYSRSLLPWKTNLDNVLFGMRRVTGMDAAQKKARALEILEAVGLPGFAGHYPWQVSGGMQQRVAIARGIASQSELLLLDEPLAAVDAQTRADMQDLLLDLAKRFDQTCVLVTHDVEEAVYMADRVLVLGPRPTRVVREIVVDLPKPRDQISTREAPAFLHARHEVMELIRSMRQGKALS